MLRTLSFLPTSTLQMAALQWEVGKYRQVHRSGWSTDTCHSSSLRNILSRSSRRRLREDEMARYFALKNCVALSYYRSGPVWSIQPPNDRWMGHLAVGQVGHVLCHACRVLSNCSSISCATCLSCLVLVLLILIYNPLCYFQSLLLLL